MLPETIHLLNITIKITILGSNGHASRLQDQIGVIYTRPTQTSLSHVLHYYLPSLT